LGHVTFATVRQIARTLPGVEEGTAYGTPAFKLNGKLMTCRAINKSAEPDTLALMVSFDDRDQLMEERPDVYYVTDHYGDYPCVLVRMRKIDRDVLKDLLLMSWRFVATRGAKK
jgi:hypothetical protein